MTLSPLHPRPSRRGRGVSVLLYLLLLAPTPFWLDGWQWGLFVPLWGLALWRSWLVMGRAAPTLAWDGERLWRDGHPWQPARCRVLPGLLWLRFEQGGLVLFADQLEDKDYRALARAIHLS